MIKVSYVALGVKWPLVATMKPRTTGGSHKVIRVKALLISSKLFHVDQPHVRGQQITDLDFAVRTLHYDEFAVEQVELFGHFDTTEILRLASTALPERKPQIVNLPDRSDLPLDALCKR